MRTEEYEALLPNGQRVRIEAIDHDASEVEFVSPTKLSLGEAFWLRRIGDGEMLEFQVADRTQDASASWRYRLTLAGSAKQTGQPSSAPARRSVWSLLRPWAKN